MTSLPPPPNSPPPLTRPPAQSLDDIMIRYCTEMDQDMLNYAAETALQAISLNKSDGEIAAHMKAQFDLIYGKNWHCIVNEQTTPDSPKWCGVMYVNLEVGPTRVVIYKISATAAKI